jgi:DNA-binding CsgD family transcriptional regulator
VSEESKTLVVSSGARLSIRESEVLEMAARGLTNPEIASRLDVTPHAIKFHLSSIYRKLGVGNRTAAAAVYLTGNVSSAE